MKMPLVGPQLISVSCMHGQIDLSIQLSIAEDDHCIMCSAKWHEQIEVLK